MKKERLISFGLGGVTLTILGFIAVNIYNGQALQLNDVIALSSSSILWLTTMTYGLPLTNDRVKESDELGQHIIAKSAKLGYFVLSTFIFIFALVEQVVSGTISLFLLLLLCLSLIVLPCIEFFVARTYR